MDGNFTDIKAQAIDSLNIRKKQGKVTVNGKESSDITGDLLKSIEKQSGLKF
jgi:isopentenyl phosphate kinase